MHMFRESGTIRELRNMKDIHVCELRVVVQNKPFFCFVILDTFQWFRAAPHYDCCICANLITSRGITFAAVATFKAFLMPNTTRPVQVWPYCSRGAVSLCGKCLSASSRGAKGNHLNHEYQMTQGVHWYISNMCLAPVQCKGNATPA